MWSALSFGAFADNVMRQALIVGIAFGAIGADQRAGADWAVPVVGSLFSVSMLLFSSISGQVAEKYETSMLFRRIKFGELVMMLAAGVGFYLNSVPILIAVLFALAALSAFFSPARFGAMPKYLGADELVRGNGLCNAGLYVSIVLGLFVGGLVIAAPGGRLKIAAVLLCAAIAGWLAALKAPRAPADAPDIELDWNAPRQAARVIGFAFSAPGVVRPMLGTAFFFYISTMITVLAPLYARSSLHGDAALATAIMGVVAIGVGIGALFAASLSKGRSGLGFSALGAGVAAISALAIWALTDAAGAAGDGSIGVLTASAAGRALAFCFGLCAAAMGLYVAPLQAAMQRRAPPRERSRIMAAGNMANAAGAMAGSLSVLAVTQTPLNADVAFAVIAALLAALVLYMVRRHYALPAGLYDEAIAGTAACEENPRLTRTEPLREDWLTDA